MQLWRSKGPRFDSRGGRQPGDHSRPCDHQRDRPKPVGEGWVPDRSTHKKKPNNSWIGVISGREAPLKQQSRDQKKRGSEIKGLVTTFQEYIYNQISLLARGCYCVSGVCSAVRAGWVHCCCKNRDFSAGIGSVVEKFSGMPEVRVRQAPAGLDLGGRAVASGRRHLCPDGVPSGPEPRVAQPPVAPDPTRPQISTQLLRRDSPPGGPHHGAQALVTEVPEGRPRQEMDGTSALGGLRQPGGSGNSRPAFPHLRCCLWHAHRLRGASKEEAQVLKSVMCQA